MKLENSKINKSHGSGDYELSKFKRIGNNVIIEKGVLVFHPENIVIGNNVYLPGAPSRVRAGLVRRVG